MDAGAAVDADAGRVRLLPASCGLPDARPLPHSGAGRSPQAPCIPIVNGPGASRRPIAVAAWPGRCVHPARLSGTPGARVSCATGGARFRPAQGAPCPPGRGRAPAPGWSGRGYPPTPDRCRERSWAAWHRAYQRAAYGHGCADRQHNSGNSTAQRSGSRVWLGARRAQAGPPPCRRIGTICK